MRRTRRPAPGSHEPFDAGLQPERTLLAWRRTCLALGVASAVVVRFATEAVGLLAIPAGALGMILALAAYVAAGSQYRRAHAALTDGDGRLPASGAAVALLSLAVAMLALACIVFVVFHP